MVGAAAKICSQPAQGRQVSVGRQSGSRQWFLKNAVFFVLLTPPPKLLQPWPASYDEQQPQILGAGADRRRFGIDRLLFQHHYLLDYHSLGGLFVGVAFDEFAG